MSYAVAAVVLADLAVIGVCVFYLSRAGQALDERWEKQRHALEGVRGALERLVAEADRRAHDFAQLLGTREQDLRGLLHRLAEQEERVRSSSGIEVSSPAGPGLANEVSRLTAAGLGPVDVARELKVDPAQVRLMLDLYGEAKAKERRAGA
jgi:hypothetical protein